MKPTSLEKRDMIVSARERGETVKGIATLLKVSRATAYNIWNLHKATNSIAPKPYPGKESSLTDEQLDAIRQAAMEESDITLAELIEKLGLPIRKSQLSRILISMRFSFKKNSVSRQSTARRCNRKAEEMARKAKEAGNRKTHIS